MLRGARVCCDIAVTASQAHGSGALMTRSVGCSESVSCHSTAWRSKPVPRRTNDGLKKRCKCVRSAWTKCPHPWHFGFHHDGREHRFSLHKFADKPPDYVMSKTEAQGLSDRARIDIRAGKLQTDGTLKPAAMVQTGHSAPAGPTVATLIDIYQLRHVEAPSRKPAAQAKLRSLMNLARRVKISGPDGTLVLFASKPIAEVTKSDIEAVRESRRAALRAVEASRVAARLAGKAGPAMRRLTQGGEVGINRLLQVLRHMFNWAVDEGHLAT
jgi:hypothetical protein